MKKIALIVVATFGLVAMSNTSFAQAKRQDWKELNEFHRVMAQTFHPSEEGNLEPIKTRIGEMVQKANALQSSQAPKGFDTKPMKKAVGELVKGSQKLEKEIKAGASDDKITKSLSSLHDTFHKIAGLCSEIEKEGHGHDHNHDHKEGEHNHHHPH